MEITREALASYQSKKAEIKELEWNLNNRWKSEKMIGNDVIFDYSKGYPMPQSVVGFDQIKYEAQQDRDLQRKEHLETECRAIEDFVEAIPDSLTRRIFRLYYIEGKKQKEVAEAVHLDRSRISRKIDDFLKNAHKAQNAHL